MIVLFFNQALPHQSILIKGGVYFLIWTVWKCSAAYFFSSPSEFASFCNEPALRRANASIILYTEALMIQIYTARSLRAVVAASVVQHVCVRCCNQFLCIWYDAAAEKFPAFSTFSGLKKAAVTRKVGLERTTVRYFWITLLHTIIILSIDVLFWRPITAMMWDVLFENDLWNKRHVVFFSLSAGTGLYSNKTHYHLLFVVSVLLKQRVGETCLLLICFQY